MAKESRVSLKNFTGTVTRLPNGQVRVSGRGQATRKANVAEGFMDSHGTFHPIRHSADYDAVRTGESLGESKRRRSKKKGWRY